MPIRVALADDHPLVLDGLEQLFKLEPEIEVVARSSTADEAMRVLRAQSPDVLLLDLMMPGGGLELLRAAQSAGLPTRIILLTAVVDDAQLLEAIRLGAQGVVLKDMAPQLIIDAIREVHDGRQWLEKGLGARALRRLLARGRPEPGPAELLSRREREIIQLAAAGHRNRAIADRLAISEGTVKVHIHNIYDKLDVTNRVDLANFARDHGLL
jgi:DNA-binding NarL/FixJ family response regulator